MRPFPLILFLPLACLGGCGAKKEDRKPPTPEAGFVVTRTEPVALPVVLAGRTAAYETSEVRPQVSGVIRSRNFVEGSLVQAGQTLYQVDPSLYQASAAQAQANLAAAQATQSAAQVRANRLRPLAQMQAVAEQDYTDAAAQATQGAAVIAQQRAALETARINLRFTRVPAPISGRIGRSLVTTGGLVTANQADALTTIQRLDPIFVDIQQSSADLLALRRGMSDERGTPSTAQVQLTLEDGGAYPYSGTLQFAESVVDQNTGTVTLRARFANSQGLLLPGMYVRATLVQSTLPRAILLPQAAVSRDPRGQATVLIVGPGNKALRRVIRADRTVGDKWVVIGGLQAGERVITEGLGKIKAGQPIVPVPAGSKPRARPAGGGAGAGGAKP